MTIDPALDALLQITDAQQAVDETRSLYEAAKAAAAARKREWEDAVEALGTVIKRVCHLTEPMAMAPLLVLAQQEPDPELDPDLEEDEDEVLDELDKLDDEDEDDEELLEDEEPDEEDEDPEQSAVCNDVHEDGMLAWVCSLPVGHAGDHLDQGAQHVWPQAFNATSTG